MKTYTEQEIKALCTPDIIKRMVESKEIVIHSEKYGDKTFIIDKEDFDRIKNYNWHLRFDKNRNKEFYVITNIRDTETGKRKTMALHRFLLNCEKGFIVDHINHNTLDNRKCNLRICTKTENTRNSRKRKDAKHSIYKGVKFHPTYKKFIAWITYNKKRIYLGSFENDREAALVYNEAAKKYYGEFACLNIVE